MPPYALRVPPYAIRVLFLTPTPRLGRYQNSFHGVNLTALQERAAEEYFRQPVVDTFDVRICLAKAVRHTLDFCTAEERDLHRIGRARRAIVMVWWGAPGCRVIGGG